MGILSGTGGGYNQRSSEYMTGGVLSKVLDVFGTGNYAAAGLASAALKGKPLLEGVKEGIGSRKSFSDVLEEQGFDESIGTKLSGLALDIVLDPTNLLAGAGVWGKAAKGATKLDEAVTAVRATTSGMRPLSEISQGLDLLNAVPTKPLLQPARVRSVFNRARVAKLDELTSGYGGDLLQVARATASEAQLKAYNAAISAGKSPAQADRLAKVARTDMLRAVIEARVPGGWKEINAAGSTAVGKLKKELAAARAKAPAVERQRAAVGSLSHLAQHTLKDTESILRDGRRMGPYGNVLADASIRATSLSEGYIAERLAHPAFDALRSLGGWRAKVGLATPEALHQLDEVGQIFEKHAQLWGTGASVDELMTLIPDFAQQGIKPETIEAYKAVRNLLDVVNDDVMQSGLRLVQQGLTTSLNTLSKSKQVFVRKLLKEPLLIGAKTTKTTEPLHALAKEILERGGEVRNGVVLVPYAPRAGYWINMLTDDAMDALAKHGMDSEVAKRMVAETATRLGVSTDEAVAAVRKGLGDAKIPKDVRFGPLQFSRELVIPAEFREKNPLVYLSKYIRGAGNRLAIADTFGAKDELFTSVKDAMRLSGYDADEATKFYNALVFGVERMPTWMRTTNAVNTITKLGLRTAVSQLLQLPNSVAPFGVKSTLVGVVKSLQRGGHDFVRKTGALLQDNLQLHLGDLTSNTATNYLNLTGMTSMDAAMRVVSSTAGAYSAIESAEKLFAIQKLGRTATAAQQRAAGQFIRHLSRLGISPETVARQGGVLQPEQLRFAGLMASRGTQFTSNVVDLPPAFRSANWRFFLKLKSYSMQQAKFIDKYLLAEVKRGNIAPAVRWAITMGVVGSPVWSALRALQKDPKDDTALSRLRGIYMTGALGTIGDLVNTALSGDPQDMAGALVGPNIGTISDLLVAPVQVAQGNVETPSRRFAPGMVRQLHDLSQNWGESP